MAGQPVEAQMAFTGPAGIVVGHRELLGYHCVNPLTFTLVCLSTPTCQVGEDFSAESSHTPADLQNIYVCSFFPPLIGLLVLSP